MLPGGADLARVNVAAVLILPIGGGGGGPFAPKGIGMPLFPPAAAMAADRGDTGGGGPLRALERVSDRGLPARE